MRSIPVVNIYENSFSTEHFFLAYKNIYDQILAKMINNRFVRNVCFTISTLENRNWPKALKATKLHVDMLYCFDNMIGDKQNLNRGLKCYGKANMHNKIIYSTSVVFLKTVLYNLIEQNIMVYHL